MANGTIYQTIYAFEVHLDKKQQQKSLLYGRTRSKGTFRNANSCFTVNT